MIKIAFATDDLVNISAHLGRAQKNLIYSIENGHIMTQEEHAKPVHNHGQQKGHEHHGEHFHNDMVQVIADCQVVIARGMGSAALESVERAGIQPILTELSTINEALQFISRDGRSIVQIVCIDGSRKESRTGVTPCNGPVAD
jgi:predicted Fe-Mo cluster-binding NifX family protein